MIVKIYIKIKKIKKQYLCYIEIDENNIVIRGPARGPTLKIISEIIDKALKRKLKEIEYDDELNK